jgi:Protein of unknown function (DUF3300)
MPKQRARWWPLALLGALIWFCAIPVQAQTAQQGAEAQATQPEPVPEVVTEKLSDEELDALVARVALYPDPLLAVVLQASTLPLEVVEAERFLEKRAKDPKAEPKKEWDSSITALLNYSSVVKMMSDDLEWTQSLGDAVLNQLGDVQDSVQQFRAEVQAAGLLKSDDKQTVTTEGDTIKIEPAQAQVIYVPMYDGAALAAALAAQPPAAAGPEPAAPASEATASQTAAAAAPPLDTQAAPAAASSAPATTVAGGSTVVYPPAYPPAYPPPSYSQPYPSFWTPGASFIGGAVVGGMLGYAIGDDNDDIEVYHHGDGYGGGRNVSGNTVTRNNTVNVSPTVNRRDVNNQTQAALRQRSGGQTVSNSTRALEARAQINQGGAAPAAATRAPPPRTADRRDAAAPQRARTDQASGAAGGRARQAQRPGSTPEGRSSAGAFSDPRSGRDARRESARGAESRAAAQARPASAAPQRQVSAPDSRPQRASAARAPQPQRPQAGGGGALASQGGGQRAAQQASRGAHSRGSGGGGGGGGRRR